MSKVILTKGLPASGKSTWALDQSGTVRVNKDSIRMMLYGAPNCGYGKEKRVLKMRDALIRKALQEGEVVIVDDTNFSPKHEKRIEQIAKEFNVPVEWKDFTDVPLNVCIERDSKRANPVGEKVIREMWMRYLYSPAVDNYTNGNAVICDIDGTIARHVERSPYDYTKVSTDALIKPVASLLHSLHATNHTVIFVSGRKDSCKDDTRQWLRDNLGLLGDSPLYMRRANDDRPDTVIKKEIYQDLIEGQYNVLFVLDDRDSVTHMWRTEIGLPTLQVEYGHF